MNTHLLDNLAAETGSFVPNPPTPAARLQTLNHFRLVTDETGIAWLTFDMAGSAANIWNETSLREFDLCLEALSRDTLVRALVLRSGKDKIFIAGADLKAVRNAPVRRVETLINRGQAVFNRLAALPFPKVALIHGACLGGGLEAALACDFRIASDHDGTRLGLPETQLGLIPAWGGSTRLPRLLGLPKALDLIVSGRQLKPRAALKAGLVDKVVPAEVLEDTARSLLQNHELPERDPSLIATVSRFPGVRQWIGHQARRQIMARTRGHYPAPLRAVEVAVKGLGLPFSKSLELERHAIMDLALTPQTEHLIDLFFRKEEASKKPHPRGVALPVHDVTVIGAGVMGAGIAQWAAARGHHVLLQDVSTDALAQGLGRIRGLFQEGVKRRALSRRDMRDSLDRVTPEHQPVPLNRYPLIIEAATEDMELKKKIFEGLARRAGPDAILATNTSALSVTELARALPHPERVIGLHFFNPVHKMPLVEVVVTPDTSEDVIATAISFVQKLGKTPVVVKDSPGFVVNRILMPYLMEAVRLYDSGLPPEIIDEAMLEFGMPMGPMRLLDEIGLDVAAHVAKTLSAAFPDRMGESDTLKNRVSEGRLGRKSGKGFYDHSRKRRHTRPVINDHDHARMENIQHRLSLLISNEAARCAHEGLARDPSDIDLAMILGTGYPPSRGGPLSWLHDYGHDNAAVELRMLANQTPSPHSFEPAGFANV